MASRVIIADSPSRIGAGMLLTSAALLLYTATIVPIQVCMWNYDDPCNMFPTLYFDVFVDAFFMVRACGVLLDSCIGSISREFEFKKQTAGSSIASRVPYLSSRLRSTPGILHRLYFNRATMTTLPAPLNLPSETSNRVCSLRCSSSSLWAIFTRAANTWTACTGSLSRTCHLPLVSVSTVSRAYRGPASTTPPTWLSSVD